MNLVTCLNHRSQSFSFSYPINEDPPGIHDGLRFDSLLGSRLLLETQFNELTLCSEIRHDCNKYNTYCFNSLHHFVLSNKRKQVSLVKPIPSVMSCN